MPRDSNGIYTLPNGYLAVAGQTIQPSQHNPPFEDVSQALTNSLPRNGAAPMTDQLKLTDGSAATPALGFNSTAGTGLFKTANGIGFAVGGSQVAEITALGLLGLLSVGVGVDFYGSTAPPGWLFPIGQNISRTTYASLWATMGSPNTGDGSTTFTMPDKRGRASFTKDDMGGSAANRLQVATTITTTLASATAAVASAAGLAPGMYVISANIPAGTTISDISGTTLTLSTGAGVTAGTGTAARFSFFADPQTIGSAGGLITAALLEKQLPAITPAGSVGVSVTAPALLTNNGTSLNGVKGGLTFTNAGSNSTGLFTTEPVSASGSFTGTPFGAGLPISRLPPGIICNHIIFAGA